MVHLLSSYITDLDIGKTYSMIFDGALGIEEVYKVEIGLWTDPFSETENYTVTTGQVTLARTISVNIPRIIASSQLLSSDKEVRFVYIVTTYNLRTQEVVDVWKSASALSTPSTYIHFRNYTIPPGKITSTLMEALPFVDSAGRTWGMPIEKVTTIKTTIQHELTEDDVYYGNLICRIRRTTNSTQSEFIDIPIVIGEPIVDESEYIPKESARLPKEELLGAWFVIYDPRFGVSNSVLEWLYRSNILLHPYQYPSVLTSSSIIRTDQTGTPSSVGGYGLINVEPSWNKIIDTTLLPPSDISIDQSYTVSFDSVEGGEYYDVYIDNEIYWVYHDEDPDPLIGKENAVEIKYTYQKNGETKTGTFTTEGLVKDGYTAIPSSGEAPPWAPDTYYRLQMYGDVSYYWLLTSEPADWATDYDKYYTATLAQFETTSDYIFTVTITDVIFNKSTSLDITLTKQNIFMHFGPRGIGLGVGELAETEDVGEHIQGKPYITTPWGYKGASYIRKVGNEQREIRENFIINAEGSRRIKSGKGTYIDHNPFESYYRGIPQLESSYPVFKDGNYYKFEHGEHVLLRSQPDDWEDNYTDYFYRPHKYPYTNVKEDKQFNSFSFYEYNVASGEYTKIENQPDDWDRNYFDYHELGFMNLTPSTAAISEPGLYLIKFSVTCDETYQIVTTTSSQYPAELYAKIEFETEGPNSDFAKLTDDMSAMIYGMYMSGNFAYMFANNMTIIGLLNAKECSLDDRILVNAMIKYYNPNVEQDQVYGMLIKQWDLTIMRTDGLLSGYSN